MKRLEEISPIDGRYYKYTEPLKEYFSEYAYLKYRFNIEIVLIKQDNKGAQLLGAFVKVCQSGSACLDIGALDRNFRRYAARLLNFALHILFQNTELNFAAEVARPCRARVVRIERRELL